ncbi:MAG: DUF2069 domain-containing protein [Gammaproteobacteria bacterium]|nr:DUF2069 domain-containing protein [Gammaproteobacteria bacterium]
MQKFENIEDAFKHAPMAAFVKKLKMLGLVGYLGLVAYYPILFTLLNASSTPAYLPLTLFWLPMLFAIRGLISGNPYTYAWSNFVLMWCYMHGLTAIWTYEGNKLFIVIELVLLTLAFIGNTYFARYRGRELGLALPKIKEVKQKEKEMFEKRLK